MSGNALPPANAHTLTPSQQQQQQPMGIEQGTDARLRCRFQVDPNHERRERTCGLW